MDFGELQQGKLVDVTLVVTGSETAADHALGATTLAVYDSTDFSEDGGYVKIVVDVDESYTHLYTTKDDDTNTLTLSAGLEVAIEADTQVFVEPRSADKYASVQMDEDEDPIYARVAYSISSGVDVGIRAEDDQETVIVQMQGDEFVMLDFVGKEDYLDGTVIDPSTIPPDPAPSATDVPVLSAGAGIDSVFLSWTMTSTSYLTASVFYEVHVSPLSGFSPNDATYYSSEPGLLVKVTANPDGTALSTTQPTYFKIRAYTSGGVGPWSNEASATAIKGFDQAVIDQLQTDLGTAQGDIDTLNNVTIPDLNTRLTTAQGDIDTLNNTTIPDLNTRLTSARSDIDTLNNTTIPDLNGRLTTAQSDISTAQTNITSLQGKFPVVGTDISDGAISTPKMTANTINGDRILANTLNADKIVAGSVTTNRMTANTIDGSVIAAGTLNASKIVAGSVTTDRMTANTIDGSVITAGTMNAIKIVAGSVTTDRMTANTIDGSIITGGTMNANKIVAGSITTDRMTANTISGDRIVGNSLDASKIAAATITATQIAGGTITGDKIFGGTISGDKLTSTAIDGKTITGALIRTNDGSGTAGRVELYGDNVRFWYSAGTGGSMGKIDPTLGEPRTNVNRLRINGGGPKPSFIDLDSAKVLSTLYESHLELTSEKIILDGRGYPQGDINTNVLGVHAYGGFTVETGNFTCYQEVHGSNVYVDTHPTTAGAANCIMGSSGRLYMTSSTKKVKKNITPMTSELDPELLLQLEPKMFEYREDKIDDHREGRFPGFIAEDAEDLGLEMWVTRNSDGDVQSFEYSTYTAGLQAICRFLYTELKDVKAKLDRAGLN